MNLLQLRYFQAVARSRHLTKTAEKLHISPPALRSIIRRLEEEIGASLFVRCGRNIELSEYGEILLEAADQAISAVDLAQTRILGRKESKKRRSTIGVLDVAYYTEHRNDITISSGASGSGRGISGDFIDRCGECLNLESVCFFASGRA